MNATVATKSINTNEMGIQEFAKAIQDGSLTVAEVITVLDQRIARRVASNRPLIPRVVEYRNSLAESMNHASNAGLSMVKVPAYAKAQPNAALPSDPDQLADVVFATVGAARVGQVIARLTARVVSP